MTRLHDRRPESRDALYNAGCWEVIRLDWEEAERAAQEWVEEEGTPEPVASETTEQTVVDLALDLRVRS